MQTIRPGSAAEWESVRELFREYWGSFGFSACFQNFEREVAGLPKGGLTAGQESAEGILGHDVGKASEALQMLKGGAMDRPSRERWLKARTRRRGQ
jgi:hypothetical protein